MTYLSQTCDECGRQLGSSPVCRDGVRHLCCECGIVNCESLEVRRNSIEFSERVDAGEQNVWWRLVRIAFEMLKFVACLAVCFSISILRLQPFGVMEAAIGCAIFMALGVCVTPFAAAVFMAKSRASAVGYPQELQVHDGKVWYWDGTRREPIELEQVYVMVDKAHIWFPQIDGSSTAQLYLCTAGGLIACGASLEARHNWRTVFVAAQVRRIGSSVDTSRLFRWMFAATLAGKVTGALIDVGRKWDIYGALAGWLLGFAIALVPVSRRWSKADLEEEAA